MKIGRYKDIEDFLFRQLPMYQRIGPKAFKKDLKNIQKLAAFLGNPERTFKSIHIAGTNGKGSTSFFIATALHALGYKVGLYTSPHYKDYRERIKIDGQQIPKTYVKNFVNRLITEGTFEEDFKPSFFEISVAMAFEYFKDEAVDYAVIETGLGGRLDSTNIIKPELSVITNIGFDHTNFLGNTLKSIATEKAGIIKAKTPVIVGRRQSETHPVFQAKATKEQTKISYAQSAKKLETLTDLAQDFPTYQQENLQTAYASLCKLGLKLTKKQLEQAWTKGFKTWDYLGRYQLLSKNPRVICDSAHNKMGLKHLFSELQKEKYQQLHIVLAMVSDKDLSLVLPLFPQQAQYYFSQAKIPRAKKKEALQREAAKHKLHGKVYSSIPKALAAARATAGKKDLILVTGSIFTVAEVV